MKKINIACLIIGGSLLFGCGKSKTTKEHHNYIKTTSEPLEVEFNGTYLAILSPINKRFSGHLNGSLTIVREDDDFIANVRFSGGPKSVLQSQNIHIGDRCPTIEDDTNGDGIVDAEEGAAIYKEVIIPLDDDLGSQWLGLGTFPVTDEFGFYQWSRSTSYKKLLKDLQEEDINEKDDLVKITDNKNFTLNENVIIITGIPENRELPDTVMSRGRKTKHQSLPIACGVIRRLTHVPGTIDTDSTGIPYSGGETVGGSSGGDDGAIFLPETGAENSSESNEPEARDNSTEYVSNEIP